MLTKRRKRILSFAASLLIVLLEAVAFSITVPEYGMKVFTYYTEDSNLLALIASALYAACAAAGLRNGTESVPDWVRTLRYVATVCLTVTFLVVTFIFAPMIGRGGLRAMLLSGAMLYTHLLCPALSLLSFLFLEHDPPLNRRSPVCAIIPTALYAVVSVALNLLRIWEGPYPFLMVYRQPVWLSVLWAAVIPGGAYLTGLLLYYLNRKNGEKTH